MKTFLIVSLLLLSSCGLPFVWWDEAEIPEELVSAVKTFTWSSMLIQTPTDWSEIWKSQLWAPKTGEIILALKSPDIVDWVYKSMIILQDSLIWNLTSMQYSRNDYLVSQKKYSGFRELENTSVKYVDWEESNLFVFEAKYNPDSPRIKFVQSSRICKNWEKRVVYNLTIALAPSITDIEKYKALIQSFECIKKEAS